LTIRGSHKELRLKTALDEEIMQLDQRGQLGARRADHHVGARGHDPASTPPTR